MKRNILVLAIAVLGLNSCKEEFVCECKLYDSDGTLSLTSTIIIFDTERGAENECEETQTMNEALNGPGSAVCALE